MITGKSPEHEKLARLSVKSFIDQTYSNKKLLIINDGVYSLSDLNCDEVKEIRVDNSDKTLKLGGLRNVALEHIEESDIWMQWDDDDYRHPKLMEEQYEFLSSNKYDVCYLETFTWYFWQLNHARAMSVPGQTIGSAMFRGVNAKYSNISKGEDGDYIFNKLKKELKLNIGVISNHNSNRYLYFIHDNNTWGNEHFMTNPYEIRTFRKNFQIEDFKKENKDNWNVTDSTESYLKKILQLYGLDVRKYNKKSAKKYDRLYYNEYSKKIKRMNFS